MVVHFEIYVLDPFRHSDHHKCAVCGTFINTIDQTTHDKTGHSRAGETAEQEEARKGGRTKCDWIFKSWGFVCLVFCFVLVYLFVSLGNSLKMEKSSGDLLANAFVAEKLFLNLFFLCWRSWAKLNCRESWFLEPVFTNLDSWNMIFHFDMARKELQ